MATATITVSLPTSRADGTSFSAADYGSADIFADGNHLVTLVGPALVANDPNVVPGVTVYTATVSDKQSPPAVSALSSPATAPGLPVVLAAPGVPSLSVTVA